jgi:hypothetical protein
MITSHPMVVGTGEGGGRGEGAAAGDASLYCSRDRQAARWQQLLVQQQQQQQQPCQTHQGGVVCS